ncbi:MAG: transglutaminase domain-containing protein [Deltaproteobacteria bacterium]|nr:transglutaminase domain-containing protein [Deltaproteobacteria bacterium]
MPVLIFLSTDAFSKTLVISGTADSNVRITQERVFTAPIGGMDRFSFRFASPAEVKNGPVEQDISGRRVSYDPKPVSVRTEIDKFGNSFTIAEWANIAGDVRIKEEFDAGLRISLKEIKDVRPFPLGSGDITGEAGLFLKPTPLVQSEDSAVKALAQSLTTGALTEHGAVTAILNWVVDSVKYRSPVEKYDAASTLKTKEGNCQNFAHLSMSLLRASGIPARIVGGIALGRPWKVPLKDGALLETIGQGGHAWIEVWYPDEGWVPYDAQQSHLFVGPRHIKQTSGLDSNDINDSWNAAPKLPKFREEISADYISDNLALALKAESLSPDSYMLTSTPVAAAAPHAEPPLPHLDRGGIKPKPGPVEFGNMGFQSLVDFYAKTTEGGVRTFDKETAEYVTGAETFAQAFFVEKSIRLDSISLAMHKFGGRLGSLWIDVVKDVGGRPGMEGIRSLPLSLDTVAYHPGYKWFDFSFSGSHDERTLEAGRYWIVLRHSKDAVINWLYTPGNRYGSPDDVRSTEKGADWPNILNIDFNFRVRGNVEG